MEESRVALDGDRTGSIDPTAKARLAVLIFSAVGVAIALAILYLHYKLRSTSGAYTSFCNINGGLNCDKVLTSSYSQLLGYPVELWGLVTYLVIATAAVTWKPSSGRAGRGQLVVVLFLSIWAALFSVYMGLVATVFVESLCLNCIALYLTNFALATAAWRWASRAGGVGKGEGAIITQREVWSGAFAMLLLLGAGATLQQRSDAGLLGHLTADGVMKNAPDFYRWYAAQPVVSALPLSRHHKGPSEAKIRIVEFSDFECGHCRKAASDLVKLMHRYLGEVSLEFRHYPLDSRCNPTVSEPFHHLACSSAAATECAGAQNSFWRYHDLLFGSSRPLEDQTLIKYAGELGLDMKKFSQCLSSDEALEKVRADIRLGERLGVRSTPTMFINDRMIVGALDPTAYEYAIAIEGQRARTTNHERTGSRRLDGNK